MTAWEYKLGNEMCGGDLPILRETLALVVRPLIRFPLPLAIFGVLAQLM